MEPDELAVVIVEPDRRLAELVVKYLAVHAVRATAVRDPSALAGELAARRYACVIWMGSLEADAFAAAACERAGVPLVQLVRMSARDLLARVLAATGGDA
ncbi:MAG TPA: hypothetical protein VLX92_27235 [Kofleriaceae bacterium]|nr:hypothetical protein [Kofleriaceae bacterium]